MALLQSDRADIYMTIEEVVGPNVGVNGYAWQVDALVGTGTRPARTTYAIVEKFAGFSAGNNFGIVAVTIVPGIPHHSGVLSGTYYATLGAAVSALGTTVAGLPSQTFTAAGWDAASNPN